LTISVVYLGLDKAQAGGYKIYIMKFLGYAALILLLTLSLVPGAVMADG
jgi:hypothetical protein